jgi:hypothetical protein
MFTLRFDMRAPAFGARPTDLYAAALEMSAWAETRGCIAAVLCEHHGSEDGYLPSPFSRPRLPPTERLLLSLVVVLPFYDPVRLAEDLAVLDIISNGRGSVIFGNRYRPENSSTSASISTAAAGSPMRSCIWSASCWPVSVVRLQAHSGDSAAPPLRPDAYVGWRELGSRQAGGQVRSRATGQWRRTWYGGGVRMGVEGTVTTPTLLVPD